MQVVGAGAVPELIGALVSGHDTLRSAAARALAQCAQHGRDDADELAAAGVLPPLALAWTASAVGSEAHAAVEAAACDILRHTSLIAPLAALVTPATPPPLLTAALARATTLLVGAADARREFLTTGALMHMQRMQAVLGSEGREHANAINELFPADVVRYYRHPVVSPGG
jgi:hypothetical protein